MCLPAANELDIDPEFAPVNLCLFPGDFLFANAMLFYFYAGAIVI